MKVIQMHLYDYVMQSEPSLSLLAPLLELSTMNGDNFIKTSH